MTVLLASCVGPRDRWADALAKVMPGETLRTDPDADDLSDVDVALFAFAVPGLFPRLPNLKLIVALQAGVDSLLADPDLPADMPLVRAGHPDGDRMIVEYALMHVMRHLRDMPHYAAAQRRAEWDKLPVRLASECRVGFMGLGLIAMPCAALIRDIGFRVAAWTRRPKSADGIESFHGNAGLAPFLARTDILVNLLPLTPATGNILCAETFAGLPRGAAVINIGRGQHVVDADLIAALDSGHLSAATLDVFRKEPLPSDDPFWAHPKISVMPHTSRAPKAESTTPQVAENIRRFRAGEALMQVVDRAAGY